jgi:integrase
MFTGERRNPIRSGNRNLLTGWKDAVTAIGRPGLHFHDLRHTGNTLAAQTYVRAVSIGYGDTMLRDQLIEDLDRFLPV